MSKPGDYSAFSKSECANEVKWIGSCAAGATGKQLLTYCRDLQRLVHRLECLGMREYDQELKDRDCTPAFQPRGKDLS